VRLLSDASWLFRDEAGAVLREGLRTALWMTGDNTGAQYQERVASSLQFAQSVVEVALKSFFHAFKIRYGPTRDERVLSAPVSIWEHDSHDQPTTAIQIACR
jgi:hypothetical protein